MKNQLEEKLIAVRPNERQLRQEEMEFYGFIHFTMNTFTGKEWGDGTDNPQKFCPEDVDTDQWAELAAKAEMKGLILTCKHHDGFCLWPSAYTDYSVKRSPYLDGKADIVKQFAESCRKHQLKVGIYLSPWDRNHPTYGYGKEYDDYFINQLTELLSNYGEIFTVWFDGACGEGTNGKKQKYDWERYYQVIRSLQPNATISICGPDIRWCGNEAGKTRESEWSVVPARIADNEKIAHDSQQEDNSEFRMREIKSGEEDLGSRELLQNERDLIWYPSEVDVSIRPGWFYHAEEDDKVRSFENLKELYLKSVGGNALLLLNIPPNPEGRIAETDAKRLEELGHFIRNSFSHNLAETAKFTGTQASEKRGMDCLLKDDYTNWYEPVLSGKEEVVISMQWDTPQPIHYVVIKEQIPSSQRVEKYTVLLQGEQGIEEYTGTTIGRKKIIPVETGNNIQKVTIQIKEYRVCPQISFIGIY